MKISRIKTYFSTLILLHLALSLHSQIIQEFYLPYPENHVFNALKSIFPGNSACGTFGVPEVSSPLRTYISISPSKATTIIYYDEWEDGYEIELTAPTQATTKIWGDNNPANGIPPGFSVDIINGGTTLTLQNNINPSNLIFLDYDARDRIGTTKPVSITKSHWASGSETLMAGTLLVYPTSEWGTSFRMPLGENVNTSTQSFSYSGMAIMAYKNNTFVDIDANNDGIFELNITLNKGEAYHINGGLIKGASVSSTLPIQVYLTTGDRCDTYESRWFNVLPQQNLDNLYFGPISGTDKLYALYNPNNTNITVLGIASGFTFANVNLAPNAVNFVTGHASSGFQFWTMDGSDFVVLALSDASDPLYYKNKAFDWGATLLPESELTQEVIIGWAPGQDPNYAVTENTAPIWMTVSNPKGFTLTNPTVDVCVDYNGDDVGVLTASSGRKYDVKYTISPLQSIKVYDPDGNQTNMIAWVCDGSKALISAVYGEDAATASPGSPGLDLGAGVPGVNPFYAYKSVSLYTDNNSNGLYNLGDVIQYTIGIKNEGLVRIFRNYRIFDLLPANLTYVSGSAQITEPTGITSIPNQGTTPFPFDENGYNKVLDLGPGEQATVTFRATITSVPNGNGCFTNTANVSSSGITYEPEVTVCVTVAPEICNNGIDDDQDGFTDCNDPDCFAVAAAGGQFCLGNTISLTASGGTSYAWSGPGGFTSTLQNPTRSSANFGMSGTYTVTITGGVCTKSIPVEATVQNCSPSYASCTGAACKGTNLLSNGSFESFSPSSPSFTSDLIYFTCGGLASNRYSMVTSASNCNPAWIAAPDRTVGSGSGNYLVANYNPTSPGADLNGNGVTGEIVTFTNIAVGANKTYCLSAFLLNICETCGPAPDVKFMVNGVTVGTVSGSAIGTSAWNEVGYSFSTTDFGNPSSIRVSLAQNNFGANGYDLGIDDFTLREVLSGTTPTLVNDAATSCTATNVTINVLANDANYVASTLAIASQPTGGAGSVVVSGSNLVFSPVPNFIGTTSFSYSVCGAASNGCCATANVTVTLAPITATANNDSPVCAGTDLHFSASGGNTYSWSGPNGFSANTAYAFIDNATIGASGTYTVTVSNTAGCSAIAITPVTITNCPVNRDPECNCN